MKTGKEVKTNISKDYNIIFGSVNNKKAKAVYINLSAWAEPKHETDINYSRVIRNINKKVKQQLYYFLNDDKSSNFIKEKTIVDFDIRESGIRYGKRSFMSCDITLFSEIETPVNSEYMTNVLTDVSNYLIKNVFDNNDTFIFHKKKK
jgi:hypothetical protein